MDWLYKELEFTEEEISYLNKKYDYIDWKFVKWKIAIQLEEENNAERKKQILSELWVLSVQLEWAKIVEDTKKIEELEAMILSLKNEYKTL